MKKVLSYGFVLISGFVLFSACSKDSEPSETILADKTGWSIRVCPSRHEATSTRLEVGNGDDDESHEYWRDWRRPDPVELDVPEKFRTVSKIWLKASVNPEGKNSYFCLLWQDRVTRVWSFDGKPEEEKVEQTDTAECGC